MIVQIGGDATVLSEAIQGKEEALEGETQRGEGERVFLHLQGVFKIRARG